VLAHVSDHPIDRIDGQLPWNVAAQLTAVVTETHFPDWPS
jgi:hypothetical protein